MSLHVDGTLPGTGGVRLEVDLEIPSKGITAIVGASGSGKTSLLRLIAGLEKASATVVFNGQVWQNETTCLATHLRPVTMVQQDGGLFAHLNVAENLALAQKYRRGASLSLDCVIEKFALADLLERKPDQLSGGQKQRVAIARALACPVQLSLLDEPMSALDSISRREIAPLLVDLCRTLDLGVLYVSHALQEVLQIADHLIVMENGRVIASGTPTQVGQQLDHPVSREIDLGSILTCSFVEFDHKHNLSRLELGSQTLWVRGDLTPLAPEIRLQVPASAISIAKAPHDASSMLNQLSAVVVEQTADGHGSVLINLRCSEATLYARITSLSAERLALNTGDNVYALIKSVALDARTF
jgi:molybdate transport system ATP-binding protein